MQPFCFLTDIRAAGGPRTPLNRPALYCWLAAVAWLTLRPDPGAAPAAAASPWWCLACGPAGGADILLNVCLFLPLGWLLARAHRGPGVALVTGVLLATSIEVLQGTVIPGRDAALGDVVANGGGALLGNLLAGPWLREALARHRDRLAALTLLLFTFVLVSSATLVLPSLALSGGATLATPPGFANRPVYRGATDTLTMITDGLDRPIGFEATFAWAPPDTNALTPIMRLEDRRDATVVAVDRRGSVLGIELRLAAARWRLRTPSWTVDVPPGVRGGESLSVRATAISGAIRIAVKGASAATERVVRLGATSGWALLNPFAPAGDEAAWRWWTLGWLAGWGALLGWAAGMRRRRLAWGLAAVGILLAVSASSGAIATVGEVIALAIGWFAGVNSRRFPRTPGGASGTRPLLRREQGPRGS